MKLFFEKIRLIFDIENWLWNKEAAVAPAHSSLFTLKVQFWYFLTNCKSSTDFAKKSFEYVNSWPKILLFRTHHLWNSTTKLITYVTTLLDCPMNLIKTLQRSLFAYPNPDAFSLTTRSIFELSWILGTYFRLSCHSTLTLHNGLKHILKEYDYRTHATINLSWLETALEY